MKVCAIAYKLLAEAMTRFPLDTESPLYWSIGSGIRRCILLESYSVDPATVADLIKAQDDRPWQGDIWLLGLPAFISEKEPNVIRLMWGTQVGVITVDTEVARDL